MRIAVTGSTGQLALSLIERAHGDVEIVTLRRPAFALEDRRSVLDGIKMVRPDVVINAAAYTAVDKAEAEEDLAVRVNGEGAGHVAEAATGIGVPLLHLSTDYVFDGELDRPYREDDPPGPISTAIRPQRLTSRTHCSSSRCGFGRTALRRCAASSTSQAQARRAGRTSPRRCSRTPKRAGDGSPGSSASRPNPLRDDEQCVREVER